MALRGSRRDRSPGCRLSHRQRQRSCRCCIDSQRGRVQSWGLCSALEAVSMKIFLLSRTQLTAWITNMVRRRKDVCLGSPSIIDTVVSQSGQVGRCGIVIQTTCLPFGMRAQNVQQSCHGNDLCERICPAIIDYRMRSPYICPFRYCLNLPENLPASRKILSLAIINVRRHRGRTLFGD